MENIEFKPWQHGYSLDYLKSLEIAYKDYNARAMSPFASFKKNNIAQALHDGSLKFFPVDAGMAQVITSKVVSKIVMHGDTVIGEKEPGDLTIKHMTGSSMAMLQFLNTLEDYNCWLYVWAADREQNLVAKEAGFEYVGGKITTFGEIFSIYFRNDPMNWVPRDHKGVRPEDAINIKKLSVDVDPVLIRHMATRLVNIEAPFENHYSNYNQKDSWSAFSLRGYSDDPRFIAKPIEMSDKWKAEHAHEEFMMQDTVLRKVFPEVEKLIDFLDGDIHRIRFMKLTPGGGELTRHTDQVDPDSGSGLGKVIRLHWPIVTAPEVIFTSWTHKDEQVDMNMKVNECWMLDTRKPHKVINGSTIERIHLVVDTVVTPKLLELLLR